MNAQVAGRPDAFDNRRSGKDRRRHIDPRYRNPAYLGFVDRRRGQRRQPVYEETSPLIREHPARRWTTRVGVMVALLFVYLLLFTNVIVCKKVAEGTDRKCTVTIGCSKYCGDHEPRTSAT